MANKMLIDATHPEETRVVVLRGNRVEEFDFESAHRKQLRGNIYLAKVTRVEPSLQAAFVDYGGNRHGFLAFSEIHPDYYQIPVADRQALIEEEERAQRAADDEVDRRSRGHRHRHRHRDRAARRDEDVLHGDTNNEPASDAAGTSAEFDTGGPGTEPASGADLSFEAAPDAGAESEAGAGTEFGGEPHPADELMPLHRAEPALTPAEPEEGGQSHPSIAATTGPEASEPGSAEPVASAEADTSGRPDHDAGAVESGETDHAAESDHGAPQHDEDDNGSENGDDENAEEAIESVGGADAMEEVPDRAPRYRRQYKIQEVIKRRQVMLVQVVKEERGTKGAALTTYLSLAGRYSVLMPNTARGGGISRKITSSEDRSRLKEVAQDLEVPEGMGVILRTAGASRTKIEIKRDFEYLLRLWETVRDLTLKSTAPKLVYEEGSLVKRSIRDLYSKDIDEVIVAGGDAYQEAKDFMRMLMPSHAKNVKPYADTQPLLSRYGVESQLDAMFSPVVQLRSGGYIVINQAEALVAIDVNSGRATREHHIEDTALKTNLEASEEVSRQLRLRDLAGLIVIDFIDMDENRNNRAVERRLKECLKHDRARIQVGRISHFGLLEMSRQRIRTSVLESSTEKCPYCGGSGHVRSVSSLALQVLRALEEQLIKGATHNLVVRTRPDVALYVLNQKRAHLQALEQRFVITITITADATVTAPQSFMIERGEQVHTVEAARALAEQSQSAAVVPVEEDDEVEDDVATTTDEEEAEGEADAPAAAAEQEPGEGGVRRRRRRRRRGGRDDRDEGAPPSAETFPEHDDVTGGNVEVIAESNGDGSESEADDEFPAEPVHAGAGDHEDRPDQHGDRRRRRRGRRGGRRSRHEGNGDNGREAHDQGATTAHHEFAPDENQTAPGAAEPEWTAAGADREAEPAPASPAAPEPAVGDEPPPVLSPRLVAPDVAPPAEPEPPRRRSTVRERVAISSGDDGNPQAVSPPEPSHAPAPEPVATADSDAEETDQPRRTGWWSRRFGRG